MEKSNFESLISNVQAGNEEAIQQLFDDYGEAIRREVRFSLLDHRLKRVVSESDVCQSVMMKLFVGLWAGNYEFETPNQLVALLKTMVRAKVADLARFWRAQRRDMRRDTSLDTHFAENISGELQTPSQIVSNAELMAMIRENLSEREVQILESRQQRMGWSEITEKLEIDSSPDALRKQFERALKRVVEKMETYATE
ncbi:ECF-type sigma factor [Polystyrenella longa]|nr:ECF-type sigma factor [Polystyrenella longa]